jgi:hypothetical protein
LKQDLFGRLRHADESFPACGISIWDAALVLKLPASYHEVIDKILDVFSLVQRSCFVFEAHFSNWADIDCLCLHDPNVSFADYQT